jgi:MinD superfamily P-loop ATPase
MIKLARNLCGRCGGCVAVCDFDALELDSEQLIIKEKLCTLCNNCVIFCPSGALEKDDEGRI